MPRTILVGQPLPDPMPDLTDGFLGAIPNLAGRTLTTGENITIVDSDLTDLLLVEGTYAYIRRCTGIMRVRSAPDPFCHHEIASLFLRRVRDALAQVKSRALKQRIETVATAIGDWVFADPHTSWRPGWARYSRLYGAAVTDEVVKYVCADYPNLLEHWQRVKAEPLDETLILDKELVLGSEPLALRLSSVIASSGWANADDRYEIAAWVEANALPAYVSAQGLRLVDKRLRFRLLSLTPLDWRLEIT